MPEVLRQPELIYGIGNLIANASDFATKMFGLVGVIHPKKWLLKSLMTGRFSARYSGAVG